MQVITVTRVLLLHLLPLLLLSVGSQGRALDYSNLGDEILIPSSESDFNSSTLGSSTSWQRDYHISKRGIIFPEEYPNPSRQSMDTFMQTFYTNPKHQDVVNPKAIRNDIFPLDNPLHNTVMNSAIFHKLTTPDLVLGMSGLRGCSSVVIFNSNAVYTSHYYEQLSLSPPPDELSEWVKAYPAIYASATTHTAQLDRHLQHLVLNGLTQGVSHNGKTEQVSLRKHAPSFKSPDTLAFLIHPLIASSPEDQPFYTTALDRIQRTVEDILPNIRGKIARLPYKPRGNVPDAQLAKLSKSAADKKVDKAGKLATVELEAMAHGNLLFQYSDVKIVKKPATPPPPKSGGRTSERVEKAKAKPEPESKIYM
ncbi:hypothetical protein BJ508DRAFT_308197 [Ascobolus immersus RN42]|uniref:Uncharacterized protein n=1 Tax=Ascobolus immersus RN42 TaxID=1160509 RepID=A0A3N4ICX1_ASCIM|nr:hypothetical protein BJ508DRAFT_308197 [Ascobolus immersus RN42]